MFNLAIEVDPDITMRLLEMEDAEALFNLIQSSRHFLRRWLPWVDANRRLEDTIDFIQSAQNQFVSNRGFHMGIWYRGQIAGVIGYHIIDWKNSSTGLGYWLGEKFQGYGIMTKCCSALVDYAFKEYGLNRIEIRCAVENMRSRAIPERLGFRKEGVLYQAEWLYDHFVDHVVYGLVKKDWKGTVQEGICQEGCLEERTFFLDLHSIKLSDKDIEGRILDIGGGGEGIIGRLAGDRVVAIDINREELDEAPEGPLKIVMDAREMSFVDSSFDTVTAFFSFMYMRKRHHMRVFREAYRVLKKGGKMIVWDVVIPESKVPGKDIFVIPLEIQIGGLTLKTSYGVSWEGRHQELGYYADMASEAGFRVLDRVERGRVFCLVLEKMG